MVSDPVSRSDFIRGFHTETTKQKSTKLCHKFLGKPDVTKKLSYRKETVRLLRGSVLTKRNGRRYFKGMIDLQSL